MADEIQFSHLRYSINLHAEWAFGGEYNNLLVFELVKDSGRNDKTQSLLHADKEEIQILCLWTLLGHWRQTSSVW